MIVEWLLKNVRVPKDSAVDVLNSLDKDEDGYISLGEVVAKLKELA